METPYFQDVKERVARKLVNAESVKVNNRPACYTIYNNETGNCYVGSTSKIGNRVNQHKQTLAKGNHSNKNLQKEYDELKDKESMVVHIALMDTVEEAKQREQLILDEGFDSGVLLNVSNNAYCPSKGYDRADCTAKTTATKNTPECKLKTSITSTANWKNEELRRKMIYAMGENVEVNGTQYGSVREASRKTGFSALTIRQRLVDGKAEMTDVKPPTRKVCISGVMYDSVNAAAAAEGVAGNTMVYRLKNENDRWKDYNYAD